MDDCDHIIQNPEWCHSCAIKRVAELEAQLRPRTKEVTSTRISDLKMQLAITENNYSRLYAENTKLQSKLHAVKSIVDNYNVFWFVTYDGKANLQKRINDALKQEKNNEHKTI